MLGREILGIGLNPDNTKVQDCRGFMQYLCRITSYAVLWGVVLRYGWLFSVLLWLLNQQNSLAQFNRPTQLKIGGSVGLGGMHLYFKPSFDMEFWRVGTNIRIAPGLFSGSIGLQQRVGYFQRKRRQDRPLFLSAYYTHPWLLSRGRAPLDNLDGYRQNWHIVMLLVGMRFWLDRPQRVFIEASLGPMYVYRNIRRTDDARPLLPHRHWILPALEIRLGMNAWFHKKWRPGQWPEQPQKKLIY